MAPNGKQMGETTEPTAMGNQHSGLKRCQSPAKVSMSTQAGQRAGAWQQLSDTHLSRQQQNSNQVDVTRGEMKGISIDAVETGTRPHVDGTDVDVKRRALTTENLNSVTCTGKEGKLQFAESLDAWEMIPR